MGECYLTRESRERHGLDARRMGADTGHDCAFQLDFFGDVMAWQIVEYIVQTHFENDTRFFNATIHQFTERHAQDWFDWPPAPETESEGQNGVQS